MNQRRASDQQDIVTLPDGRLFDRNAYRALMDDWRRAVPKPVYVARLSLDDGFCRTVEAESRERAA